MRIIITALYLLAVCFATAQNKKVSSGFLFDGEPYLEINPVNPQHMVVAWMSKPAFTQPVGINTRVTFNGGLTWSNPQLLPHGGVDFKSADPSLAFDNNGLLYACYIDHRENPDSGGVYVAKSSDGGLTWNAPVKAIDVHADGSELPIDRPWLAIDKSNGPYSGTLYITTKPAPWIPAPNRPYLVKSQDGGDTWGPWQYVDSTGWLVGNVQQPMAAPDVSADGILHIVYPSWQISQNILPGFLHAKSVDGGASFQYNSVAYSATPMNDTLSKNGYGLVCNPANPNHLALVSPLNLFNDPDVFLIESFNGGATWNSPIRVNDDAQANGKMQDLVWGGFDTDGDLVVAWRDRRNAAGTGYEQASEIWGAVRWKDSTSFSANFSISDTLAAYNALYLSGSGNDFMNVQLRDDTLAAVWGDVRSGKLEIWFERMDLKSGTVSILKQLTNNEPVISVFPNPATHTLRINSNGLVAVSLCDISGRLIRKVECTGDSFNLDTRDLKTGTYLLNVETHYGTKSIEFQKQ